MIAFYAEVKWVHVLSVLCSGMLFLLRGTLMQVGRAGWARSPWLRYLSYTIDSILLTAALMLVTMLPSAMFTNGWLTVKLVLLPVYIALGVLALRESVSGRRRIFCFVAALGVFALMASIARSHHPMGVLRSLLATIAAT
jgi:uncharacterized membrane protein SirB2